MCSFVQMERDAVVHQELFLESLPTAPGVGFTDLVGNMDGDLEPSQHPSTSLEGIQVSLSINFVYVAFISINMRSCGNAWQRLLILSSLSIFLRSPHALVIDTGVLVIHQHFQARCINLYHKTMQRLSKR